MGRGCPVGGAARMPGPRIVAGAEKLRSGDEIACFGLDS